MSPTISKGFLSTTAGYINAVKNKKTKIPNPAINFGDLKSSFRVSISASLNLRSFNPRVYQAIDHIYYEIRRQYR